MELIRQFKAARRAGVPLVAVETADPANLIRLITDAMNGSKNEKVLLQWDIMRGAQPLSEAAQKWLGEQGANIGPGDPSSLLIGLQMLPESGMAFMLSAHAMLRDNPAVVQGVWNLRDPFKAAGSTLVLVGPLGWKMPADIKDDVVMLTEPLPDRDELKKIAVSLGEDAKVNIDNQVEIIADAVGGLSAFGAEQVIAMSLDKNGVNEADLWERKRKAIEQTPGLSVWRGGQTFSDIGGYDQVKKFLRRLVTGKKPPRVILFIDEIEKAFAGAQGDTSGVSQDFHGTFLSWAEDHDMSGCIFIGPPGSGKTAVSKATGAEANVPTIAFDFNGMKASLVGESGARLRSALAVVDSVGGGNVLALATCNSIGNLSPELRRRFKTGTFFFDLPTDAERPAIWKIWRDRCEIPANDGQPDDSGWTGAEIKQCCDIAYRLNSSLIEAAEFIVPVARAAAEQIKSLREQAVGRYLSASYKGTYRIEAPVVGVRRRMNQ